MPIPIAARQVIAFKACGVLRKLGFRPSISTQTRAATLHARAQGQPGGAGDQAEGYDVRVYTGSGQDFLDVDDEGAVRRCRPEMDGWDRFPAEWR